MKQGAFLRELAGSNRTLLGCILAWLLFAGFSAWTKFEATPLHMWNMFAVPLPEQNSYTVTTLYADGQETGDPAAWHYFSNMVTAHSSAHYLRLQDGTYPAPEFRTIKRIGSKAGLDMEAFTARLQPTASDIKTYPAWLKRYTESRTGKHIDTLKLVTYTLEYNDSGRLNLLSEQTIFTR